MSDNESDSESLASVQDRENPRTSWIFNLKKPELTQELKKFGLPTAVSVKDARKTLTRFFKGEYQLPQLQLPEPKTEGRAPQTVSQNSADNSYICSLVRKWNLSFDGEKDVMAFLERLEELREAYAIEPEQLLLGLPELLKGKALLWYRNSKTLWDSWEAFIKYFEVQFLPPKYHEKLNIEIRSRVQGINESFKDYLVAIQTLMRRHGHYSPEQQFQQVYENMLPEYKLYVLRRDTVTIHDLLKAASDYEAIRQAASNYQPPGDAAQALYPEVAYQRTRQTASQPKKYASPGQHLENLNSRRQNRARENRNRCWNCDKSGHYANDCRLPKRDKCRFCQKDGKTMSCRCPEAVNYQRGWRRNTPGPQIPH